MHCVPVGHAGNISSHWIGYSEYLADGVLHEPPRLFGFEASGAAPLVLGQPVKEPHTIATAIRIGNPASWDLAMAAASESEGAIMAVTDRAAGKKGISAFVVDRGTPGFRAGKKEDKLGVRSSVTSELAFEDCRLPAANLVGREGMGFVDTLKILDKGRVGIAALLAAAQVGSSVLWLRRFRMGPVVWLWRAATYMRRPPMLR